MINVLTTGNLCDLNRLPGSLNRRATGKPFKMVVSHKEITEIGDSLETPTNYCDEL